jgi:hypothetical protein
MMTEKTPKDIKLYLGVERRVRVDEMARDENRSVSDTISQLIDMFLDNYATIKEEADLNHRTPILQARMWIEEGVKAQLALDFVYSLTKGDRPSDATCIELASELTCDSETLIKIRDCAFNNGEKTHGART